MQTDGEAGNETFTLVQRGPSRRHLQTQRSTWEPELRNSFSSLPVEDAMVEATDNGHTVTSNSAQIRSKAKRPQILTNEKHLRNYVPQFTIQRPGTNSYAESVSTGPNTLIVSDSMLNRIRKFEFSSNVKNGRAIIKTQPGEQANVIHAYLRAKLATDNRSSVVIHAGSNNLCDIKGLLLEQTVDDIVHDIIRLGETCREFGVNKIAFSGLVIRRNGVNVELKRRDVNARLQTLCHQKGYIFIDNDNVIIGDIENKPHDKVHLLESGSVKLANNILRVLNGEDRQFASGVILQDPCVYGGTRNGETQSKGGGEPETDDLDFNVILQNMRVKNIGKVIIANLNVASLPARIDELRSIVKDKIDILVLTETHLDGSYPTEQFLIDGYKVPYREDRNKFGGAIMIYIREDIPSKILVKHIFPDVPFDSNDIQGPIEGIFVEINLRKSKWLLFGTYHRPKQCDSYYFDKVAHAVDFYAKTYDKFLLAGDFNINEFQSELKSFLTQHNSSNLVKDNTCFKSVDNPSCIDLFITNSQRSFQNTKVLNVGCSDFHKMAITVMKTTFAKLKPKEVTYRNYKEFDDNNFKNDLINELSINRQSNEKCEIFEGIFLKVLDKHAPLKTKIIRGNHAPYMNTALRKAIMKRTQLQNKYYKSMKTIDLQDFRKQRNYVSRLYKKQRKKFYNNIDLKLFTDNKKFWKNVNSLFSDKSKAQNKITLVEDDKIITDESELAQTFNDFFKNAVKNLNIDQNTENEEATDHLTDPVDIALH